MNKKIAILVGSLRKESLSRKVASTLMSLAPSSVQAEFIELGTLPFYNQDLEDAPQPPVAWQTFRKQISHCDAVLFVTPEYNRSIPAVLKNAIDVGSRPYGQSCWNNKPAAIISVSPGGIGGFGAHHHVRQSLACLNMPLLPQPEAYIGMAMNLFDEHGELVKEETKQFLQSFMNSWLNWLECFAIK